MTMKDLVPRFGRERERLPARRGERDPFRELQQEMNHLFDDFFSDFPVARHSGWGDKDTAALAFSPASDLYVAAANRIRKISRGGVISTIAGLSDPGFSGDGGPRAAPSSDLAVDAAGVIYVADTFNHRIADRRMVHHHCGVGRRAGDGGPPRKPPEYALRRSTIPTFTFRHLQRPRRRISPNGTILRWPAGRPRDGVFRMVPLSAKR
jgi:hypothetical protein